MVAVEKNPKSFRYIGKILKNDVDIIRLSFQRDKEILRFASERLRKINIQSKNYQSNSLFIKHDYSSTCLLLVSTRFLKIIK